MKLRLFALMLVLMLAACNGVEITSSSNTSNDAAAAQSFMPDLPGYTSTQTTSVQDAIAAAVAGGAGITGNLPLTAAVERIDTLIDCYRERGAVDARIYVQNEIDLGNVQVPPVGALAIINQTRVQEDFLSCITQAPDPFRSQSAGIQPCTGSGSFTFDGDTITYVYGATNPDLCAAFENHFSQYMN